MTFITKAAAVLLGSGLGLFVPCAWAQQTAPATAAAAAPISLQAALALAMEHNPGLRAAAQALAASEGALIQSRARPNPELAYSQEDTRRETRSMTLQWNQSIEIGGKREATHIFPKNIFFRHADGAMQLEALFPGKTGHLAGAKAQSRRISQ